MSLYNTFITLLKECKRVLLFVFNFILHEFFLDESYKDFLFRKRINEVRDDYDKAVKELINGKRKAELRLKNGDILVIRKM